MLAPCAVASLKEPRHAFFFFNFTCVCKTDCYIFSFHFFVHSFLFSLVNISPILWTVLLVLLSMSLVSSLP